MLLNFDTIRSEVDNLHQQSVALRNKKEYEPALKLNELALSKLLGHELDDMPLTINMLRTRTVFLLEAKQPEEGLQFVLVAYKFAEILQDKEEMGSCLYHIGRCYGEGNNPAEGLKLVEDAINLRQIPMEVLRMTIRKGEFLCKLGRTEEGIAVLEKALEDLIALREISTEPTLGKVEGEIRVAIQRLETAKAAVISA